MSSPPANVQPDDLWARITALPRPHQVVPFPRHDADGKPVAELAIWVLTQEESMAACAAADKVAKTLIKETPKRAEENRGYDDLYNNAGAIEMLFRACRRKDDLKKPFFPSPQAMRSELSDDEVGVLFNEYLRIKAEVGPIVSEFTEAQLEEWIDVLAKGGESFPFGALSPAGLSRLLITLASRIVSFSTGTSSPGSPPGASASETPQVSSE